MDTIRRIIFHHHFRKKPKETCNVDTYRGKIGFFDNGIYVPDQFYLLANLEDYRLEKMAKNVAASSRVYHNTLFLKSYFLARLASSLLEPCLCNSLTDDNDNDGNDKKVKNFEKS